MNIIITKTHYIPKFYQQTFPTYNNKWELQQQIGFFLLLFIFSLVFFRVFAYKFFKSDELLILMKCENDSRET